jgi:Ser/Thr protein kinase RdoA (MazF antagonist)
LNSLPANTVYREQQQLAVMASVFTPAAVATYVSRAYGLAVSGAVLLHRGFNDTCEITADDGVFIARVYRCRWRTREQVLSELEILRDLSASGVPVSSPIARRDESLIGVVQAPEGERFVALFQKAAGNLPAGVDRRLNQHSFNHRLAFFGLV